MRRTKILSLFALLLALAMLLVSCGGTGAGTVEVKSLLDKKATVESDAYGDIEKVTDLTDVTRRSNAGDLYYFTAETEVENETYTKHIVYNAATNQILTILTDSETVSHSVRLLSGYDNLAEERYFSAYITVTSSYDSEGDPAGASATLYAADGTLVDSKSYPEAASSDSFAAKLDLILFDDVLYRANAEGIEKLADVDPFAGLPSLGELGVKVGDYYYSTNDSSTIKVYDESLQFLSSYELPEYAVLIGETVLGNGNLLVQYKYVEDNLSEDYDYLEGQTKYQLVTEIVTAKNGKVKEIKCDYYLGDGNVFVDPTEMGLKAGKFSRMASGSRITDRRIGEEVILLVDDKGNLNELADFNGEAFDDISYVADGIWAFDDISYVADGIWEIETEDGCYLIDAKGKVLAETSAADCYRSFIVCDGKFYDYDLAVIYDYEANGMEIDYSVNGSITLRKRVETGNTVGYDYYLFTGSATLRKIVDSADEDITFYGVTDGYYILRDNSGDSTKYVYYKPDGTVALTLTNPENSGSQNTLSRLGSGEDYALYTALNSDGETVVYRATITH